MEQPLSLHRSDDPAYQWEQLYRYFANAEEANSIVTSVSIQRYWSTVTDESIDLKRVRRYMDRYWRWLLVYIKDGARPYHYHIRHIKNYPPDYFVQAHLDHSRMHYLKHFALSIDQDKERRRRAMGTGHPRKPRSAAATPATQEMLTFNHEESLLNEESLFDEDEDFLFDEIEIQSEVQAEDEDLIPEEEEEPEQHPESTAQEHTEQLDDTSGTIERVGGSDGSDSETETESHEPPHKRPYPEQLQEQPPALVSTASVEQEVESQQHTPQRLWLLLTAGIAIGLCIVVAYFLLTRPSR